MATIRGYIERTYNFLFYEISYPYTKGWLLATSPFPLLAILLIYNLFCIKIGPMIMKNRPPYKLVTTIKLYNIFQVVINLYIVIYGSSYLLSDNYNFRCEGPDDISDIRTKERVAGLFQVYFFTKLTELLDTVFFVLRKSYRQISFLHLYHHTIMAVFSWVGVKYAPGGQGAIIGILNCIVHVFMYIYYFLSGLGPQYQKYLWWKKYLTMLQIVQFLIIFIHSVNTLFYSCSYAVGFKIMTIIESATFTYMFSRFYYNNYIKVQKRRNKIM